jgi:hypothetical protein
MFIMLKNCEQNPVSFQCPCFVMGYEVKRLKNITSFYKHPAHVPYPDPIRPSVAPAG